MPLQKLAPQGGSTSANTQSATRPQIQHRRRTLQTISELSSTDLIIPSFTSSIKPEAIQQLKNDALGLNHRKAANSSKRQSLPQYRTNLAPQPSVIVTSTQRPSPQQSRSMPIFIPTSNANTHGNGYNAKRDRARSRQEQELVGARLQQMEHSQIIGTERLSMSSRPSMSSMTSRTMEAQGSSHLDQQYQLLRNSRSMTGIPQVFEQPQYPGDIGGHHYDHETEPSERTSTTSSSARDAVMGRSRSGSSNTSYTSQESPPLPKGSAQNPHGNTPQEQDLVSFGESARSKNLRSRRSARTFSLPSYQYKEQVTANHACSCSTRGLPNIASPSLSRTSPRRAHAEALAALTASNDRKAIERSTSLPGSGFSNVHYVGVDGYVRHASLSSHPTQPASNHGRIRYYADLQYQRQIQSSSSSSAQMQKNTSRTSGSQTPRSRSSCERTSVDMEKRALPRRESLTQWKAERDEAKASLIGGRRATMQERVRRANELEEAREKELVSLGKRPQDSEAGCFGGLLTRMRNRRG